MKKLLALLLLSPLVSGEEESFELTCEGLELIYYISLNKDSGKIRLSENSIGLRSLQDFDKEYKVKKIDITDKSITFEFKLNNIISSMPFRINRYTGAFTQRKKWADWSDMDGYCYKGFKEYTDKQI